MALPTKETVKDAQRQLANLGLYQGKIDGIHGPKTQAALLKVPEYEFAEKYLASGVRWIPTENYSHKWIEPELILIHYTACTAQLAISGFLNTSTTMTLNGKQVRRDRRSAHYIIRENGEIIQMVGDKRRAWHAGISEWKGRKDVNSWSIGIELENYGSLTAARGKMIRDVDGRVFNGAVDEVDGTYWHAYSWIQLDACAQLCASLKYKHPKIVDMAGHSDVTPDGRKKDPGKHFPWAHMRKLTEKYYQKLMEG